MEKWEETSSKTWVGYFTRKSIRQDNVLKTLRNKRLADIFCFPLICISFLTNTHFQETRHHVVDILSTTRWVYLCNHNSFIFYPNHHHVCLCDFLSLARISSTISTRWVQLPEAFSKEKQALLGCTTPSMTPFLASSYWTPCLFVCLSVMRRKTRVSQRWRLALNK